MRSLRTAVGFVVVVLLAAGCGRGSDHETAVTSSTENAVGSPSTSTERSTTTAAATTTTATVNETIPTTVLAPTTLPLSPTLSYSAPLQLEGLSDGSGSSAVDINNSGVIVGTLGGVSGETGEGTVGVDDAQAAWWPTPTSPSQPLGVAPGELSFGVAVNDGGQILVRTGHPEVPKDVFVVYPPSGASVKLSIPYGERPQPWAMNDRGEVLVNAGFPPDGRDEGMVWDSTTGHVESPPGLVGTWFTLADINDRGDVVGHALADKPFLWDRTTDVVHYLDIADATMGVAIAVNGRGQIVGRVSYDLQTSYAAIWDSYSAQPLLFGDSGTYPSDINETGQIIGDQQIELVVHPWVRDPSTKIMTPLSATGQAFSINDLGQVVGAIDGHATLWNPL